MTKYLLYKDYESGLANELTSIELAVGLAHLTQRTLVYYGSMGETKQLKPVYGGRSNRVPISRQGIINNHLVPTLLDVLEDLPISHINYSQFQDLFHSQKLTLSEDNRRLVDVFFLPKNIVRPPLLNDFADSRSVIQDVDAEVWHLYQCNLGYYSRFFYLPLPPLYTLMEAIRPKLIYRELAAKISQQLGLFNGVHVRLTDFRQFLPQEESSYKTTIFNTLKSIFPPDELLVICTDESENKEFFTQIMSVYKNHLFLDELVLQEFRSEFKSLPFTDEVTLGLICNLVMHQAHRFVGTPGSTFSGMIHRNWYRNQLPQKNQAEKLAFKYVNSGFADKPIEFQAGSYLESKPGYFSWNRVNIPISTDAKSWYREWPESVILDI